MQGLKKGKETAQEEVEVSFCLVRPMTVIFMTVKCTMPAAADVPSQIIDK